MRPGGGGVQAPSWARKWDSVSVPIRGERRFIPVTQRHTWWPQVWCLTARPPSVAGDFAFLTLGSHSVDSGQSPGPSPQEEPHEEPGTPHLGAICDTLPGACPSPRGGTWHQEPPPLAHLAQTGAGDEPGHGHGPALGQVRPQTQRWQRPRGSWGAPTPPQPHCGAASANP